MNKIKNIGMIILSIIIIILVVFLVLLKKEFDLKRAYLEGNCNKEVLSNGMMTLKSYYDFEMERDGSMKKITETRDYTFHVEHQYDVIRESKEIKENFECEDTYSKDKKMICKRTVEIEDNIWYRGYVDSFEAEGYKCTIK